MALQQPSERDRRLIVTGQVDVPPPADWFDLPGVLRPVAPRHDLPKPRGFTARTPR